MSHNLEGTWIIHQTFGGGYKFPAHFTATGDNHGTIEIDVEGTKFFGTYQTLGSTSYISLAIGMFEGNRQSISAYVGNVVGGAMGGLVYGAPVGGKGSGAEWTAHKVEILTAEEKAPHITD
ncbi:MAG: hypothetical protein AAF998_12375 [Bacteroidota bacterium]